MSHGANWAVWPQSEIQPDKFASLGCGHPSLGPRGTTNWAPSHHSEGKLETTAPCLLARSSLRENYPRSEKLALDQSNIQS